MASGTESAHPANICQGNKAPSSKLPYGCKELNFTNNLRAWKRPRSSGGESSPTETSIAAQRDYSKARARLDPCPVETEMTDVALSC